MGAGISVCLECAIVVIDEHAEGERGCSTKAEFLYLVSLNICFLAQVSAWQGSMSLFKPLGHDAINSLKVIMSVGNL